MYRTWNFWTCRRTASRNSTERQQGGGVSGGGGRAESVGEWCRGAGESPCLGRSSGEMLSMVRERDGLIGAFSDIIYRNTQPSIIRKRRGLSLGTDFLSDLQRLRFVTESGFTLPPSGLAEFDRN